MESALVLGILGLIIGSFLNVLILRFGEKKLSGRSACPHCGTTLQWFDLIPIVSWLVLRGRCRSCKAPISIQYPLVEALTALLFAAVGLAGYSLFSPQAPITLIALASLSLLIAIAVYDLYWTLIPDAWVYGFILLAFVSRFFAPFQGLELALHLAAGPIAAFPLFALWAISKGAWMGFGDVKLALGIGWMLGPVYGLIAIFFAFVIGAAVSVPLLFFSSDTWKNMRIFTPTDTSENHGLGFTIKSEIPFGPFLIASFLILWFMQIYGIEIPLALWSLV